MSTENKVDLPHVYVFSEFSALERLKDIVGTDAVIIVLPPPPTGLSVPLTNIKIFYNANMKSETNSDRAYNLANKLIKSGFCKFETDQLYITAPDKKIVALPKDRIILTLADSKQSDAKLVSTNG